LRYILEINDDAISFFKPHIPESRCEAVGLMVDIAIGDDILEIIHRRRIRPAGSRRFEITQSGV
jgi:hypothetical protein